MAKVQAWVDIVGNKHDMVMRCRTDPTTGEPYSGDLPEFDQRVLDAVMDAYVDPEHESECEASVPIESWDDVVLLVNLCQRKANRIDLHCVDVRSLRTMATWPSGQARVELRSSRCWCGVGPLLTCEADHGGIADPGVRRRLEHIRDMADGAIRIVDQAGEGGGA